MSPSVKLFVSLLFVSGSQAAGAQALTYFDCDVENVRGFRGALNGFYETLAGGPRPVLFLDDWVYTDGSLRSHRVIAAHADYQSVEAFNARIGQTPEAQQALGAIESLSDCVGPGLAIQRGVWGNQEAQVSFFMVFNIAASDGAAYAAAFQQLVERRSDGVPGPIYLFENRAGMSGVSHIVVIGAPSMASLNTYLDSLFASQDFARFSDAVRDIRTIVSSHQVRRTMVLAPEGS
jgi:hypothetical protein